MPVFSDFLVVQTVDCSLLVLIYYGGRRVTTCLPLDTTPHPQMKQPDFSDRQQITSEQLAVCTTVSADFLQSMSDPRLVIDMQPSSNLPPPPKYPGSYALPETWSHEPEISSTTTERKQSLAPSTSTKRRSTLKNKPNMSYVSMIVLAINSVPERQLTLSQIYEYMKRRWSDAFDREYVGWKNSVRHNLSLNDCFVKVPKEVGASGKGHKWTLMDGWQSMFENQGGSYKRRPRGLRRGLDSKSGSKQSVLPVESSYPHPFPHCVQREAAAATFSPLFYNPRYNQTPSGEFPPPYSPKLTVSWNRCLDSKQRVRLQ